MDYIPVSGSDKKRMMEKAGIADVAELFSSIPAAVRIKGLRLPEGMSEHSLVKTFESLSRKNASLKEYSCFLGAGIYEHFIPTLVEELSGRPEFTTAYTPYQPEASQGTLQAIFEYQSLIVKLTGMEAANASLYDGASATAEAALLALRVTGKTKVLVSSAVHPEYRQVLATYLEGTPNEIVTLPLDSGATSLPELKKTAGDDAAALIVQSPNFFGVLEDFKELRAALPPGTLLVAVANPVSLGLLKPPGRAGADIVAGEGQVLGNPAGAGGFTFGFLACKRAFVWKMPGRIVGQTTDKNGKRGFVLTLQSREQHIRREKATSNICTNAALNALAGCVYLAGWGDDGLRELGTVNIQKSHYAFEALRKIPGFAPAFPGKPFFNEFVLKTTKNIAGLREKLLAEKIIGPLELGRFYPEYNDCLLFCVTEARTKEEIDRLAKVLAG